MDWMLLPFRRYTDFQGRSRRKEYWMFALLNILILLALSLFGSAVGVPFATMSNPAAMPGLFGSGITMVVGLISLVWLLVIIIPSIALVVRRLHDRNLSGWWYLGAIVASFIPVIGFLAGIALLVIMLLPGTPGPNRFGPDPKDPGQARVFA